MNVFDVVNIWRILNPQLERYTYRQKSPLIQTRLDYFLISNNLQDFIANTDIIPSIRSDHSAIVLHIKEVPERQRGNGHWKFNSSLISNELYTTQLVLNIEKWKNDYLSITDKRVSWDLLKYEIRKYTMLFSAKKEKRGK